MEGYYSNLQHEAACLGVAFPNGSLKMFSTSQNFLHEHAIHDRSALQLVLTDRDFFKAAMFVEIHGGKRGVNVYFCCPTFPCGPLSYLEKSCSNTSTRGLTAHIDGSPVLAVDYTTGGKPQHSRSVGTADSNEKHFSSFHGSPIPFPIPGSTPCRDYVWSVNFGGY